MPFYCWKCACGYVTERLQSMQDERPEEIPCERCGHGAIRNLQSESARPSIFRPFVTTHLTGQPVTVTSEKHHKQLMAKAWDKISYLGKGGAKGIRVMEHEERPEKLYGVSKTQGASLLISGLAKSSGSESAEPPSSGPTPSETAS